MVHVSPVWRWLTRRDGHLGMVATSSELLRCVEFSLPFPTVLKRSTSSNFEEGALLFQTPRRPINFLDVDRPLSLCPIPRLHPKASTGDVAMSFLETGSPAPPPPLLHDGRERASRLKRFYCFAELGEYVPQAQDSVSNAWPVVMARGPRLHFQRFSGWISTLRAIQKNDVLTTISVAAIHEPGEERKILRQGRNLTSAQIATLDSGVWRRLRCS
jgi:hypothetical protein